VTAKRIHLVGASGSGTTTLGRSLARHLGCPHFDTDHYFWFPTDPPFEKIRPVEARRAMLGPDLARDAWVLSGSLCGWGDVFIPRFDLVVFLSVPSDVRLARLRERERERYGEEAIAPGGRLRAKYEAFIAWAASYEEGSPVERSRRMHEEWLAKLPCPVLRLEDTDDIETRMKTIGRTLSRRCPS
jgi:adenylate kinase family enzyme